jgi:hypothetical protein
VDAAIHAALALAVRLAEKEDQEKRTPQSAELVRDMRIAAGAAEVYDAVPRSTACRHTYGPNGHCIHCEAKP